MSKLLSPVNVIPKDKRKKILLLSDDLRFYSGIATVSRELVLGTVGQFNWVQLGAAARHPDDGKVLDVSEDISKQTNIDSSVRIYCNTGYGDPNKIRELISIERPDAILHFTDPRYWDWLYMMESEIRTQIPLLYLNIWDDLPDPQYNETAYASCDLLLSISKQTYGINKRVLDRFNHSNITDKQLINYKTLNGETVLSYLPHGINANVFKPVDENDSEYLDFKKHFDDDFLIVWNNRNIYRKQLGTLVLAFKYFVDVVKDVKGKEVADKIHLLLKTQATDEMGTDIPALIKSLAPDCKISLATEGLEPNRLNYLYNIADVTVNVCSNEGFGLGTAESIMAGTPVIINVTGGLQDQAGFINPKTQKYFTEDDYVESKSLHIDEDLVHGEWCKVVYPSNRSIQGSIPTPYIFDDRVDYEDVALLISEFYNMTREQRKELGLKGREFMLSQETLLSSENMCTKFTNVIYELLDKWKPKDRFSFVDISKVKKDSYVGDTVLHSHKHYETITNNLKG